MEFFDYATGLKMTNEKFSKLFGKPVRNSRKDLLTQFHMDIASSIQVITEEIVLRLARSIAKDNESKNLCMSGGVALNCVANGKILKEKIFENFPRKFSRRMSLRSEYSSRLKFASRMSLRLE